MRYEAWGYIKPSNGDTREPNSSTALFNGTWGCWGALAHGARIRPSGVVNQIVYHTELNLFGASGIHAYVANRGISLEQAVRESVDAILEGYIDYEVEMTRSNTSCIITFKDLHDKRRQRTMWALFALRCWFTYNHQGKTAKWLLESCKTSLTLREVILYSQVMQSSYNAMSSDRGIRFYYSPDGSNAAYLPQLTLTEWRRLLKGGYYNTTNEKSDDLWGKGGGYFSGQQVQRTANSWQKLYGGSFHRLSSNANNLNMYLHITRDWIPSGMQNMSETSMQKFVRFVKYRKK